MPANRHDDPTAMLRFALKRARRRERLAIGAAVLATGLLLLVVFSSGGRAQPASASTEQLGVLERALDESRARAAVLEAEKREAQQVLSAALRELTGDNPTSTNSSNAEQIEASGGSTPY